MSKPHVSPHNLIQERYWPDPWKILVCCMMLNLTTRKQMDPVAEEFFQRWPTAEDASQADPLDVADVIRTLGLYNRRAKSLIRMSAEFAASEWTDPRQLHGVGQYAADAYTLFVLQERVTDPHDHALKKYAEWADATWKS